MQHRAYLKNVGKIILMIGALLAGLWVLDNVTRGLGLFATPFFLVLAYWIGQALLVGWVAGQRGRKRLDWFLLGMLYSFIALIALAALPHIEPEGPETGHENP